MGEPGLGMVMKGTITMSKTRSYRWRPAPWRVGQSGESAGQEVPSSAAPAEEGKKKTGTVILVLVGAATVAFGVMELLGITRVFATPAPALPVATSPLLPPLPTTVPPPAVPAPVPGAK